MTVSVFPVCVSVCADGHVLTECVRTAVRGGDRVVAGVLQT